MVDNRNPCGSFPAVLAGEKIALSKFNISSGIEIAEHLLEANGRCVLAPLPLTRTRPFETTESVRNDTQTRSLRPQQHREPELVAR